MPVYGPSPAAPLGGSRAPRAPCRWSGARHVGSRNWACLLFPRAAFANNSPPTDWERSAEFQEDRPETPSREVLRTSHLRLQARATRRSTLGVRGAILRPPQ